MYKYFTFICLSLFISNLALADVNDFNFGIVINNKNYQIYRSSYLGEKGITQVNDYLKNNHLPTPKTIVYMNDEGYKSRVLSSDFAIQQYKLQEKYGYKMFHSFDYKQRTYLDGNDPTHPTEDIDTKENLNEYAAAVFGPNPQDGLDGDIKALYRILDIVLDPANQPVLFHCFGGKHRTGMVAMILRYLQSDKAQEIVNKGPIIQTRAEVEYEKYAGKLFVREPNVKFVRQFLKTNEFKDYQNRFRPLLQ